MTYSPLPVGLWPDVIFSTFKVESPTCKSTLVFFLNFSSPEHVSIVEVLYFSFLFDLLLLFPLHLLKKFYLFCSLLITPKQILISCWIIYPEYPCTPLLFTGMFLIRPFSHLVTVTAHSLCLPEDDHTVAGRPRPPPGTAGLPSWSSLPSFQLCSFSSRTRLLLNTPSCPSIILPVLPRLAFPLLPRPCSSWQNPSSLCCSSSYSSALPAGPVNPHPQTAPPVVTFCLIWCWLWTYLLCFTRL